MAEDKPHVHNHTVSEVSNPAGVSSDGKRAVYVVQDHHVCTCGDFFTVDKGVKEV